MVGAGVGAGAGAGLGTGIGGIGGILIHRRRRLPHPSAELEIIPMINTTIKRDANFVIFTLKNKLQMITQSTIKRSKVDT